MYNDDDEEIYEEEQEGQIEDEIAQRRQINELNKMNARPSTKIGTGIKNKASGAVKGAVKGAAKGIARGAKALLGKVAIFLITNPIILLALVIIIVIIMIYFAITNALSNSVTSGVDNYINSAVDDMGDASKEAYEKNSSLLLLKVSEINELYNQYIKDKNVSSDIRNFMKGVFGTNEVQGEVTYEYKKQFTPKDVLNAAKKLTDRFSKEKYLYGVPMYVPARSNGNTAGNETNGDGEVIKSVAKCMSSNGFVSWVLSEVGLTNQPKNGLQIGKDYNTENVGLDWFCEKNGFKKITSKGDLKSGDIVFLKNSGSNVVSHVYIFDNWNSSDKTECKAYDCGSKEWIQGGSQPITRKFVTDGKEFFFAYRPQVSGTGSGNGEVIPGDTNTQFRWPLPGYDVSSVTCWFGEDGHNGFDIEAPEGTKIIAAADGYVESAEYHYSWGNNVYIKHNDTYYTRYAHMVRMEASAGQQVKRGQVVGYVGNTGNSFGNHLHFEVYQNGTRIDPYPFIKP